MSQSDLLTKKQKLEDGLSKGKIKIKIGAVGIREEKDNESLPYSPPCPGYIYDPTFFSFDLNFPVYDPPSPGYNPTSPDHLEEIGGHESSQVDGGNKHDAEATRIIQVPCSKVALLAGAVATIRFLQHNLCARIRILKDSTVDLKSSLRQVELTGTVLQIEFTQQLIDFVLAEENHDEIMEEETKKPSSDQKDCEAALTKQSPCRV